MRFYPAVSLLLIALLSIAGCSSISTEDQAFIDTRQSAITELTPIITDFRIAAGANDIKAGGPLGTKLSTRSQFWHDKIEPMPASSKYQDSKSSYVLALGEMTVAGQGWSKGSILYGDGKNIAVAASVPVFTEAAQHFLAGLDYFNMSAEALPVSTSGK